MRIIICRSHCNV